MLGRRCNLVVANTKLTSSWHRRTSPCSQPRCPEEGSKLGCAGGVTEQSAWPAKDTSLGQTRHSTATGLLLWSLPKLEKPQLHSAAKGKGMHSTQRSPAARAISHTNMYFLPALTQLLRMLRNTNR